MSSNTSPVKLQHAAVDYLTITTKTSQASAQAIHKLYEVLGPDWVSYQPSKPWRFMGYAGRAYEGVRYGLRGDQEAIIMLSSGRAGELWEKVAPTRSTCTRIDLAVTIELEQRNELVARQAYEQALEEAAVTGSLVVSSRGGQTCYLGSRTSKFFGRLYDKGAEQDLDSGWIWRYEVETKKPASEAVVSSLLESTEPAIWVSSYVWSFFNARGVIPLFPTRNAECAIEMQAKVTTADKQLEWLRTQVKPTVARLVIAGREQEVREALGLPEYKDNALAQLQEAVWLSETSSNFQSSE